jgi:Ca2+/Na+ antiporter
MLNPPVFRATTSLSFDNLRKASSTPIMTDIGTTKTRKEGMEQINMRRTEVTLTPWFTIRSVILTIFAIMKIKVNKNRLVRKGGIISLKIYLLTMLLTFM